ncbi:hypothetical protein [Billgrantia lactosivorans]|uniref:hypothetical protein n=1 Tax=Billgrantia lactosivorans TaxID=2185141 RepID=UPI0013A6F0A6|nr:hypothetical protein [Halomonas lactosivorans]
MRQVGIKEKLIRHAEVRFYYPLKKKIHASFHHKQHGVEAPEEGEVVWVNPRDISGHMFPDVWKELRRRTGFNGGALLGGNWDIENIHYMEFTKVDPYLSCHEHWIEGKDWSQTPLYQNYVEKLGRGEPCRFSSVSALRGRYEELDIIFSEVMAKNCMSSNKKDLVRVSVARDANLIWGPDGRHRVCMAICAGLDKMPAMLGFVHSDAINHLKGLRSR